MTARPTVLILPCHSLDDFPTHHEGDEAAGLLASWTAPWHPVWIASTGETPKWIHVDLADTDRMRGSIVLTPKVVDAHLPDDFQNRIREAGADRLEHFSDRASLVTALRGLQRSSLEDIDEDAVDEDLVADFHSLGYWFLQIELLARQISYHSNLDEHQLRDKATKAAKHAVAGERDLAKDMLRQCFGLLIEERDHYYPVDAYLLDIALVAPNTSSKQLRRELERTAPANLWFTGSKLRDLHAADAAVCESIASAVEDRKAGIIGGEFAELPLPLLSAETLRREWMRGLDAFRDTLGVRPNSYFRRQFGLTPRLASLLGPFGWSGAIHATLDAGKFPVEGQACSLWKDNGSAGIAMLNRVPLDAALPQTFLKLAITMGRSMETDYVATACLARWAGTESEWFDDVRRANDYGLTLGASTTCDDYFQSNHPDVHGESYRLDQYRSAYLQQAVGAGGTNPISNWVRRWRAMVTLEAAQRLASLSAVVGSGKAEPVQDCLQKIEDAATTNANGDLNDESLPLQLLTHANKLLAGGVAGYDEQPNEEKDIAGWLLLNPYSHPVRADWELNSDTLSINTAETQQSPIHAIHAIKAKVQAAVDMSGSGFAWLPAKASTNSEVSAASSDDTIVERSETGAITLRNEFCSIQINSQSGGIGGVYDFHSRGNRLSQRLARSGESTTMKCDQLTVDADTNVLGSVTAKGQLLDEQENPVAKFEQTTSLTRGSRIARIHVRLEPSDELTGAPWKDYFAIRWAWPNETDELTRCIQGAVYPTDARRCESPSFFEVSDGKRRTALLSGGLPFHHRHSDRMLDSLLLVAGETQNEFEMAVGIDLPQAVEQSESHWLPSIGAPCPAAPQQPSGWLFHVGSKHVRTTGYTPIWEESAGSVTCVGMRVRMQEQSGGSGSFRFRGPRPIVTAVKTNFVGDNREGLTVEDGVATITIDANEWTEVECRW